MLWKLHSNKTGDKGGVVSQAETIQIRFEGRDDFYIKFDVGLFQNSVLGTK